MIKLIILIILALGASLGVIILYKKEHRYRALTNVLVVIIAVFFVYNIFIGPGYRLTGYSSARANAFIDREHEWIDSVELDGNEFHMFYNPNDNEYMTVFVDKLFIGYRSNISTHFNPHYEDAIRTIGAINVEDDGRVYSVFLVETEDADVSSLAIIDSDGNILVSKNISRDEPIQLAYEYTGRHNYFNCELVAFNDEGVAVYYYGYEHGDNNLSDDEYKWYTY